MAFELPTIGKSSSGSQDVIAPFKFDPPKRKKKSKLTARQFAAIQMALQDHPNKSLGQRLKGVGKGAVGGATWALTQLMRPSWAVASGTSEALSHLTGEGGTPAKNPISAAMRGFAGQKDYRKGFGQVLEEQGVLKGHRRLRGGLGLGLDIVTDPILALSVASDVATAGATTPFTVAYLTAKSSGGQVAKHVLEKAAIEQGKRVVVNGATDDIARMVLKDAGAGYEHRLGLAEFGHKFKTGELDAQMTRPAQATEKHIHETMAEAEMRKFDPHRLTIKLGYGRARMIFKTPFPAVYRPGQKIAQSGIPIISQISDKLGKAFVPGFNNEMAYAGGLARKHIANQNALIMRNQWREHFTDVPMVRGAFGMSKPDNRRIIDTLHLFEKPLYSTRGKMWKAVLPLNAKEAARADLLVGQSGYKLNEQYIKLLKSKGMLDDQMENFIREWFDAVQMLDTADIAAGVVRENWHKSGSLYVPHIFDPKTGEVPGIIQKNLLSKASFQKNRELHLSVKEIEEMIAKDQLPKNLVTDPFALLWRRTRAGAERQSDMALIRTLAASVGIPSKIVDEKALGVANAKLEALLAEKRGVYRAAAHAEQTYHEAFDQGAQELMNMGNNAIQRVAALRHKALQAGRAKSLAELEGRVKSLQMGLVAAKKPETIARLTKELDDVEKQLARVGRSRPHTPDMMKHEEKIKVLEQKRDAALAEYHGKSGDHYNEVMGDYIKPYETAIKAKDKLDQRIARTTKQIKRIKKGKKNPEIKGKDLIEGGEMVDRFGNTLLFPRPAGEQIARLTKIVRGEDPAIEDFQRAMHGWMSAWKQMVTVVNPGYRIRNTMTDFWNMWLAGVPPWEMRRYGVLAADTMSKAAKAAKHPTPENLKALEFVREAGHHGISAGLFAGDITNITRYITRHGTSKELAASGKPVAAIGHAVQEFNKTAENWGRMTHYLYRRIQLQESAPVAARAVKIAHFDYEDLTPFEQRVMKNIFPFYTWTRKNIPYQVKKLFTEPGRYSVFPKMAQEATYVANEDPSNIVPDYVESGFGFANPWAKGNYLMPQLGVSDLQVFQSGKELKERPLSLLGPLYKIPAELAMNKSMFTGQPIANEDHPFNPISDFGGSVLSGLGIPVHQTRRSAGAPGEYTTSKGINPWLGYAIGQVPMGRAFFGLGANTSGKRASQLGSYLGGMNNQMVDQKQQVYFQSRQIMADTDKLLAMLRDAGKYPTEKREASEFDKMLLELLKRLNRG